jgi:3,4-dihydroxy 2-butanone 4-phosphate synthase/GTP cyclohydrolase II
MDPEDDVDRVPSAPTSARTAAGLSDVETAVARIARGEMVVVVDSPDRENEGDLVMAAECVTPHAVNFMATHGRGLICVPLLEERLQDLRIGPMVERSTDPKGTAFCVTVDHRDRTTTGISASDRANTIRALADPASLADEFTRPGHVFPLAYQAGGVLKRAGHTEAAIDLARLAGLRPAAVICEIAGEDGEMARLPQLVAFAEGHGLPVVAISDVIAYRLKTERLIERTVEARLPLDAGGFTAIGYRGLTDGREHVAVVMGDVRDVDGVLVRMHSECLTGDVFGSARCDCGEQLSRSLELIAAEGRGAVVYLRGHEGRGIGLMGKLHAYRLQDGGLDTVDANRALGYPDDRRDYGIGMQILVDLGIQNMRLLTNNPAKRAGLEGYGLRVVERVPLQTTPTPDNISYLRAKRRRLGHLLDLESPAGSGG